MNPKLESLFQRRSIRQYTGEPVPANLMNDILEAGMAAPSAMGKNPWHMVVLQSREAIDKLAACLPNGKMLAGATAALLVCGDINQAHDKELSFLLQDTSAAIENMLLAASMLGLGACWLGIHPREERLHAVSAAFGLPQGVLPIAGISLGWPGEVKEARTRLSQEQIHGEQW